MREGFQLTVLESWGLRKGVPETRLCVFGVLFASELGYIPKTDNDDTISSNRAREGSCFSTAFAYSEFPFSRARAWHRETEIRDSTSIHPGYTPTIMPSPSCQHLVCSCALARAPAYV
jgi:hypothetical protein